MVVDWLYSGDSLVREFGFSVNEALVYEGFSVVLVGYWCGLSAVVV